MVSSLATRVTTLETKGTSVSSESGSARSWKKFGHGDGSTATGSLGSHGPGSSVDNRNTRRRLDTFSSPEDEHARSAVLLRFPCEQYHTGITKWSTSVRLEFVSRPKCQDFVVRFEYNNDISYEIDRPFCNIKPTIIVRQSDTIEDREIGNNFRFCGENWLTNLKFSFLMEMTKVHSSSQRSILAHMSSASKIAETELENRFSDLLLLDADKRLPLFRLIICSWCFLLKCCNVFSLKPTRSMCAGRFFASLAFLPPGVSRRPFPRFPSRWVLRFVLSLTRGVIVHDSASCSSEDSLDECGRPCDALSCLLFSALWLRSNQSILVQETQSAKVIYMTCPKMLPIKATTCLHLGPMSLDWLVDRFSRYDFSRSSLSLEVPSDEQQRSVLPASTRSRCRLDALQAPPQKIQRTTGWDGCGTFLSEGVRCITIGAKKK